MQMFDKIERFMDCSIEHKGQFKLNKQNKTLVTVKYHSPKFVPRTLAEYFVGVQHVLTVDGGDDVLMIKRTSEVEYDIILISFSEITANQGFTNIQAELIIKNFITID